MWLGAGPRSQLVAFGEAATGVPVRCTTGTLVAVTASLRCQAILVGGAVLRCWLCSADRGTDAPPPRSGYLPQDSQVRLVSDCDAHLDGNLQAV